MLPRELRITRSADFRAIVRAGVKATQPPLVVHLLCCPGQTSRAGLVVSKAVGSAVTRHRVSRRLRHLLAVRLPSLDGAQVVVRALPAAATASSQLLATSLDGALAQAGRRAAMGHGPRSPRVVSQ